MNKSFTYLLPLFIKELKKGNKEIEEILFVIFVEECYCIYKVDDKEENLITIKLEKPKKYNEIFSKYLSNLKRSIIFTKQHNTETEIFITFNVPKELEESYNCFLNGSFSKIKPIDKTTILKFIKNNSSGDYHTMIRSVLIKSDKRRKVMEEELKVKIPDNIELSSKPDLISETFKLN